MNISAWLACKRCPLWRTRKRVVLGRGTVPAALLFIGEAPGKNEDLLGLPFIGQSGKILDKAREAAAKLAGLAALPAFFITNACACRPCDSAEGDNRPPTGDELWACFQRLQEEAKAAAPEAVIFLGKTAEKATRALFPAGVALQHPAYILRTGGVGSPAWVRFIRELSVVFGGLKNVASRAGKVRKWSGV